MTAGISVNLRKFLLLLLIILGSTPFVHSQRKLTGNLSTKKYPSTHVSAIGPDWVQVSSLTDLSVGDTLMLIQMQGIGISTDQGLYGAAIQSTYGSPGRWEIHIIKQITVPTKQLDLQSNILLPFDIASNIQAVKVPSCNNGVVTGTLEVNGWDPATKSGGVLAIIASKTLKLTGNINITGKGFSGGRDTVGDGVCSNNLPAYDKDSYTKAEEKAGIKGEGIAIHDEYSVLLKPAHYRGQGPNYTGGGGGNARYTGGGGGSNRGIGGQGGEESQAVCVSYQHDGGYGGFAISALFASTRIFFGGGGGGSTSASGLSSVPGDGNGGGIVFIITDTLIGNGGSIISSGKPGYNGSVSGGAGGGGAGGSVVLSLKEYSGSPIQFGVSGGKGGNNTGRDFGAAGGGGGGLLWVSKDIRNAVDIFNGNGGAEGTFAGSNALPGTPGEKRIGSLDPNLKGFLFNTIWSTGSGLRRDTVCSDKRIPKLAGTNPIGGTTPYSYLWEKSYNNGATWVPSVTTPSYDVSVAEPAGTILFRRRITDSSGTPIVDISIPDTVVVQPAITGNAINVTPDIICTNQVPAIVVGTGTLVVPVPGDITYKWSRWSAGVTGDTVYMSANNNPDYLPSESLTKPTVYRRIVESGRCRDKSATKLVTVLPLIAGNAITSPAEEKCFGATFTNLAATMPAALSGGDGAYTYRWVSSTTGTGGWNPAAGINNAGASYNPDETTFNPAPDVNYFRRVVYSGAGAVCKDTTAAVKLTMWATITGNTITAADSVCLNNPVSLSPTGTLQNGSGSYTFEWQVSNDNSIWATAPSPETNSNYTYSSLAGVKYFRRVVYSGAANACVSNSASEKVSNFKPITASILNIADTVTCNNLSKGIMLRLHTGKLPVNVTVNNGFTDLPVETLTAQQKYLKWQLPSDLSPRIYNFRVVQITDANSCTVTNPTATRKVNVYKYPVADAGPRDSVCGPTYVLKAAPSTSTLSWWKTIPPEVTVANPNLATSQVTVNSWLPTGWWRKTYSLVWREENGDQQCFSEDNVTITFAKEPYVVDGGVDFDTIYTFDFVDTIRPIEPTVGTGFWRRISPAGGPDIEKVANGKYLVTELSNGLNNLEWVVENGICKDIFTDAFELTVKGFRIMPGFSPNGDGVNDTLSVIGVEKNPDASECEFTVMNSAGTVVFKTSNISPDVWKNWDGLNSKGVPVPDGTYFYTFKVRSYRVAEFKKKTGFIIVKRSTFR